MLYDSGNSNQGSVTTSSGGKGWEVGQRFKKEGTYVHLCLIHVDVWQKSIQHCKAIILQLKINLKKRVHKVEGGEVKKRQEEGCKLCRTERGKYVYSADHGQAHAARAGGLERQVD